MPENSENKAVEYAECPKCRKRGYYKSKDFFACRYCGYTAPETSEKREHDIPFNKLDHGTKPGGLRY
jgi:tRNA(Ile2) C34 agmatinyltransferase TiaS